MPLNIKGKIIMKALEKQYGAKKGKDVFYAMETEKKIKNVTKKA